MKNKEILLFSGGIDSYIAYHYLNKPATMYFDLQNRYAKREKSVVLDLIPNTIIEQSLDFSKNEHADAHIPFRNLLLAAQAAKYTDTVWIIGVKDDRVSDNNKEIFIEFSNLLSKLENRNIIINSPFWEMYKSDIVKWYIDNVKDSETLKKTISCYSEYEPTNYCGRCSSCFRKWNALFENDIRLPFHNKYLLQEYKNNALNGLYSVHRNKSIINCISKLK